MMGQAVQVVCLGRITRDLIEEHFRVSPRTQGFYRVQLARLRWLLKCESLDYRLVVRKLNELGLMVIAYRHNGSNKTWVLAIDPAVADMRIVREYLNALTDSKTKVLIPLAQSQAQAVGPTPVAAVAAAH